MAATKRTGKNYGIYNEIFMNNEIFHTLTKTPVDGFTVFELYNILCLTFNSPNNV